jgi:hypothetical protein
MYADTIATQPPHSEHELTMADCLEFEHLLATCRDGLGWERLTWADDGL